MKEVIELYINELVEHPGTGKIELIWDDVTGHHKDNGLIIACNQISLVRKNIIRGASIYKLIVYLAGEVVLNLKFGTAELMDEVYQVIINSQ